MTPEQAATAYPNLFKISEDGILEIYADNHILSSFRKCPGYFMEFIQNNRHTKGRNWSLEFGQYFHKVMEYFYKAQQEEWRGTWDIVDGINNQNLENFLAITNKYWNVFGLNYYTEPNWKNARTGQLGWHPSCEKLGGYQGAFNLFLQYYNNHYQTERLRVVGMELSFGRSKEVSIGNILYEPKSCIDTILARLYYCGRIDLVVDDCTIIGPMDHKTTSYFDGTERSGFKPHDGMQGYVYSFQKMLPESLRAEGRTCNSIYINHVALQTVKDDPSGSKRFKHSIISYTPAEMEEWRLRQVRTFTDIYRTIILEEPVYWNTELCDRWYYSSSCPYKALHEIAPLSRDTIAKSTFVTEKEQWSHERV